MKRGNVIETSSLFKYGFLLQQLVSREIKVRYKRSVLGILWSLLNPLLMMFVLNLVFSYFFKFSIPNFLVYYLTGYVVFMLLSESTAGGLNAIIGNAGLISKVYIPTYVFPLAKALSALVNNSFSLAALLIITLLTGEHLTLYILLIPLLYILLFLFVYGFTLLFAALTVYFRDLVHLHSILMLVWMYLTPIFYPAEILPPHLSWIKDANPITPFVQFMRKIALKGEAPDLNTVLFCVVYGVASLALGWLVFRSCRKNFMIYL